MALAGRTPKRRPENAIDKYAGARLRMRRLMLSMSQQTLSGLLGISFQQLQKYEKGINRISASRLQQIANILDVQPEFFFNETVIAPKPTSADTILITKLAQTLATRDGVELMRSFSRIERSTIRKTLLGLIEDLAVQR